MQFDTFNANSSVLASSTLPSLAKESFSTRQKSFAGIISQSEKMQRVFSIIEKVAKTGATVLILGETGTGKELVARATHKLSGRRGPLIPVNCGAIPEDILESELFGHEKGAFTGAVSSKVGRFQMAEGGTIFLDEIGEMSPKLQVKLLRVLQEHRVEPVGSTKSIEVDVRVIAATNKDLREEVKAGRFREDLFYRLQVIPIKLPPLRERGADVKLLSDFFVSRACERFGLPQKRISEEVSKKLANYNWPGNIRELENMIERLVLLSDSDTLDVNDFPGHIAEQSSEAPSFDFETEIPSEGVDFNALISDYENHLIMTALAKTNGNKKAAAKLLHLNRTTLVEKIKKKGLETGLRGEIEVEVTPDDVDPLFEA